MSEKIYISKVPNLLLEWDWAKNDENQLYPNKLLTGSNKKVWWKCVNNHEYIEVVYKKAKGKPCPYCANKRVLIGFNDLNTLYPNLVKEWDSNKNDLINIDQIVIGSHKNIWWKCSLCGKEWRTSVEQRTKRGTGCPRCGIKKRTESRNKTILKNNGSLNIPLLLNEWDYEGNGDLLPTQVTNGSGKSVSWICSLCGYKWKAKILNRAIGGRGCPYCANKVAIQGKNDLMTTHPELVKEWDFEKNINVTPQSVTYGSGKKVYWICPKGHRYQATVLHRTSGTNCPICNSGRQTSFAEQAFLFYIKKIHPDALNRYTEIFNNGMELDIYIPSIKVAIEYDGVYWHRNNRKREELKYQICQKNGIKLIRIKESEEYDCIGIADKVFHTKGMDNKQNLNSIIIFVLDNLEMWNVNYKKNPISVDVFRDEFEIRKYMVDKKSESLDRLRPDLAQEWCYENNGNLLPSMFSLGSGQKVWWKCTTCGNIWRTSINHRIKGTGCNVCYQKNNRGANHSEAKKIYQYSIEGIFLGEWDCISEASRKLKINSSNLSMCAKHQRNYAGGYRWEYFYQEKLEPIIKIKKNKKGLWGKPILQVDENGNIVHEFKSLNEAAQNLKIDASSISKVLNGHIKRAGGYYWKFKK